MHLRARADVLLLLARTDPDRSIRHKGLSLFIVPKERGNGHGFELTQEGGGRMEGRSIDTIGYRGMHSYEIAFDSWFVHDANLVGGEEGSAAASTCRWPASRTDACRRPPGPSG